MPPPPARPVQGEGPEAVLDRIVGTVEGEDLQGLPGWREALDATGERRAVVEGGMPEGGDIAIDLRHQAAADQILHHGRQGHDAAVGEGLHQKLWPFGLPAQPGADMGNQPGLAPGYLRGLRWGTVATFTAGMGDTPTKPVGPKRCGGVGRAPGSGRTAPGVTGRTTPLHRTAGPQAVPSRRGVRIRSWREDGADRRRPQAAPPFGRSRGLPRSGVPEGAPVPASARRRRRRKEGRYRRKRGGAFGCLATAINDMVRAAQAIRRRMAGRKGMGPGALKPGCGRLFPVAGGAGIPPPRSGAGGPE